MYHSTEDLLLTCRHSCIAAMPQAVPKFPIKQDDGVAAVVALDVEVQLFRPRPRNQSFAGGLTNVGVVQRIGSWHIMLVVGKLVGYSSVQSAARMWSSAQTAADRMNTHTGMTRAAMHGRSASDCGD